MAVEGVQIGGRISRAGSGTVRACSGDQPIESIRDIIVRKDF
jgi:hypothetical protein